jgi:hypothetical protein
MFVSKLHNDDDDNGFSILNSNIQSPDDDLKSIAKVEQDGNLILFKLFKSFNSCKICNLMVIVKSNKTSFFIKFFKKHLITTEIIKISAECNNNTTKEINYNNNNNNSSVLFTGTNYKKIFFR